MQIGNYEIIMLVLKVMGFMIGVTYIFYAVYASRNIHLANKVLNVSIYPLFKILCIINIIIGVLYLLLVLFV